MATKRQLAEQIVRLLGRTSPESRYDKREIELNVGQVRDELLVQEYYALMQQDIREIPADWLTVFTAEVQYDPARQREYVQLPYQPLHLPGDQGLFSLAPELDEFNPYVPTRPGELGLLSHHPAFALGGRVGFWREAVAGSPDRAWFQRRVRATSARVLGKVVATAAALGPGDELPFSPHLQDKIIDLTRQRFATKPAADLVPDGRDQTA